MSLLKVEHLIRYFSLKAGLTVHAVDDLSFSLEKGKTLGLVGESGCGKSTVGRAVLRLLDRFPGKSDGKIIFDGQDLNQVDKKVLGEIRKDMQMVFQNPYSALNPRINAGRAVQEPLNIYNIGLKPKRKEVVKDIFKEVGLEEYHMKRYPHEFSGGQRQRICVARALALEPKLIIADEPTSALDVSIQAQIINLLKELQEKRGLSFIFISHDLNIVENVSDDIAIMYLGQIVEHGPADAIFNNPKHPYTHALLSATPVADPDLEKRQVHIEGEVPSPINPPKGCRFHTRCPYKKDDCSSTEPEFKTIDGRLVSCHNPL
ncbi:MAG: dipeptide ABC transporter ATP-binding protein [Nanoarchaeota archaeon]|nr:dipeptide ABC transporter ATP-binding protein [Nanoarchaeota archaeon]